MSTPEQGAPDGARSGAGAEPPLRRLRSLPLRTRLTLITSGAVAVAVAVMAVICWFLVRDQLYRQLDNSLRENARAAVAQAGAPHSPTTCSVEPRDDGSSQDDGRIANPFGTIQLVAANGSNCIISGSSKLVITSQDLAVANGTANNVLHDSRTESGTKVRVDAVQVGLVAGGLQTHGALLTARPLSEVTSPLNTLALVLLAAAGIGVVGAGTAGLWIARAGLKPVDRLTATAEHIARTEDLSVRLPVEGRDEIARLSASFNSMTAALASSRDRQQQLIADAGHELRTPLTSLRTNIELLQRSEATGRALAPEVRTELMSSVRAQVTELASLIGDLQELSRPDAARTVQVVALHEVAGTALARARLRGPDLRITADISPWYVRGEAAALERAIVNLLDNAVKFSPSGGEVTVALRDGVLTVRDHGPGIPAEDLPHVFERFWRSPSARSLPGSGLGLSIVARTAEQSGGEVSLAPAPGGGALATLRLPGAPVAPPGPPTADGRD